MSPHSEFSFSIAVTLKELCQRRYQLDPPQKQYICFPPSDGGT